MRICDKNVKVQNEKKYDKDLLNTKIGLLEFNQRQTFLQRNNEFITNDGGIIDIQNAMKQILFCKTIK